MSENSLTIFTQAARMLAEADTIQKTKELKDLALTAADWAKRKGMGEEAIKYANSYALEAERKMGQLLKETERARPAIGSQFIGNERVPMKDTERLTLSELGLTKRDSAEAQMLATLPEEIFEAVKLGEKTRTQIRREQKRDEVTRKVMEFPTNKYRVLYADPPWKYGDELIETYGPAVLHYPPMALAELCALPIQALADNNAVLFLWATSPMLPEALKVVDAWGFKYKASFIWDKIKHNMGHYNSVRHEFLLICIKGSCLPDSKELIDSVQVIERKEHSEKPEEFRHIIDTLYTVGKRIELFARKKVENWDSWGNEVE